jgi:hypothetical protein
MNNNGLLTGSIRPRQSRRSSLLRRALVLTLCWLGFVTAGVKASAQDTWLFSPYRVNVWIAHGPSVRITSIHRRAARQVLNTRVSAWAKSTWDMKIWDIDLNRKVPAGLRADIALHPEDITASQIQAAGSSAAAVLKQDKLLVVSVLDEGLSILVRVRELDCRALSWSRMVERRFESPQQLGDQLFSAVAEAFSPVVRFSSFRTIFYTSEAGQEKSREVMIGTVRAAGLMYIPKDQGSTPTVADDAGDAGDAGDDGETGILLGGGGSRSGIGITAPLTEEFELDRSLPTYIGPADVLRVVVRRNDRYGKPLKDGITEVVATYMFVQKLAPTGDLECKLYATGSSAKNPARARSSSRTHKYGLLVRPTADKTDLRLVDRDQPDRGLGGYTVFSKTPQFPDDANFHIEEGDPRTVGQTDWRGVVEVDRLQTPLRILYVRNGQQMLARVPVVAGLNEVHTALLPSDDLRLQVESFIVGFQLTVMDLVIQRLVLSTRIKAKLKDQKPAEAREIYAKFTSLQSKEDLVKMLDDRKRDFTGGTLDKWSRQKIDGLFSRTRALMDNYLDANLDAELLRTVPQTDGEAGGG